MGRISLPYLNKAGQSMFWDSMWDDKHNYTLLLNNSMFIHECVPLIFDDFSDWNLFFFKKKSRSKNVSLKKYSLLLNKTLKKSVFKKFLKKRQLLSFLSKTWIFRYQSWLIIYMYVYISNINSKYFNPNFFSYENDSYQNIYFNYYYNLKKHYYNNSDYIYNSVKKNSF